MPERYDIFEPPSDPQVGTWRYLDFTKFVSMLESGGIFLPRSDRLGDPFEGSYSKANEELRPQVYADQFPDPSLLQGFFSTFSDLSRWMRQWVYVTCWHMNDFESAAMWKLYAKTNESVAIKSTYAILEAELPGNVRLGVVKYIDYRTQWMPEGNFLYPFLHKRKSFEHENELRGILLEEVPTRDYRLLVDQANAKLGEVVPVNLNALIESIYIAPSSPQWFSDLVRKTLVRYGVSTQVIQSSLDDEPFF